VKMILMCLLKMIKAITVVFNYNFQQVHYDKVAIQNVSTVTKNLLIQTAEMNSVWITIARSISTYLAKYKEK
jgi:hypothetical protein